VNRAAPLDREAYVVIHRHVGLEIIKGEAAGDIVADDHVVGWQAVMGLVADGKFGATHDISGSVFRAAVGAVVHHRVVDDLAAMYAGEVDAPTGQDDIVRHREVCPIAIEGVDALKIRGEWQVRIGLTNDPVAIDHDVFERHGLCGRESRTQISDLLLWNRRPNPLAPSGRVAAAYAEGLPRRRCSRSPAQPGNQPAERGRGLRRSLYPREKIPLTFMRTDWEIGEGHAAKYCT
jgi:hypothetical protein